MAAAAAVARCAPRAAPSAARCALSRHHAPPRARRRAYSGGGGWGGGWGGARSAAADALGSPVYWLLGANVAAFAVYHTAAQSNRELHRWFNRHMVLSQSRVRAGYWDCMVGSAFFHVQPLHLLFNMMALHSFGSTAAMMLGGRTFLGLYFTSALCGSAAQLYYPTLARQLRLPAARTVHWDTSAVGASAAIAGVTTYVCCRVPRGEVMLLFIPVPNWVFVPLFVGGSLYMAYSGRDTTYAHAGHLGGAAAGFALFLARRGRF